MLETEVGSLRTELKSIVLEDRINDETLLPFERDRRFADDVLGWLSVMTGISHERDEAIGAVIRALD